MPKPDQLASFYGCQKWFLRADKDVDSAPYKFVCLTRLPVAILMKGRFENLTADNIIGSS